MHWTAGVLREAVAALGKALPDTPKKIFRIGMLRMNAAGQAEGGHALLPYATKKVAGNKWQILVYDSNHPGEDRAIEVDADADSWQYQAATNPAAPTSLYSGKGKKNRLFLIANDLRVGQQPCPFCPGGKGGSQTVLSFGDILASVETAGGAQGGNTEQGYKDDAEGVSVTPIYGLPSGDDLLADLDKVSTGDACDPDADGDGIPKTIDYNDLDASPTGPCTAGGSPNCAADKDCALPAGSSGASTP
ncbi:MAG: hypothetical protein HY902_20660 [Deltaproteobacteria bacterium]|nr:hypothetical protein [Deltaproteobacteria bacterium]